MSEKRVRFDENFKKNAVRLSYTTNVAQLSRNLGVSKGTLHRWRRKYTKNGELSLYAKQWEVIKSLNCDKKHLSIENDMLKKGDICWVSLYGQSMIS